MILLKIDLIQNLSLGDIARWEGFTRGDWKEQTGMMSRLDRAIVPRRGGAPGLDSNPDVTTYLLRDCGHVTLALRAPVSYLMR